ncbi:hypothetical protein [Qipengyuania flava]|uniref:hypothetical protein n=1 Tax=Qipengyuania flava TaxID=192812 RepID=UPI001C635B02|nr:hypothetical protein [Qipengyuania flava]QYJ07123.1 hypothetical protein KUV82_14000 [Qipengyuania flava]
MIGRYSPAVALETFASPLRNIKLSLDGTGLIADLIPSVTLDSEVQIGGFSDDPDVEAELQSVFGKGRPIVEGDRVFRLEFDAVQAVVIQEEFVDLFNVLAAELDNLPKIPDAKGAFPFLVAEESEWRSRLPDYQGGDDPELKHFKIFSMETQVDILGRLAGFEWVRNSSGVD